MIEDVFAVGVTFKVKRKRADNLAVSGFGEQMLGSPAGLLDSAARTFERLEKIPAEKRVVRPAGRIGDRVPLFRCDLA